MISPHRRGNAGTPAHLSFTNTTETAEPVFLTITHTTFSPDGAPYPLFLDGGDDFNSLHMTLVDSALPAKMLVGSVDAGETFEGPVFLSRVHSPGETLDDADATYVLTGSNDTCTVG